MNKTKSRRRSGRVGGNDKNLVSSVRECADLDSLDAKVVSLLQDSGREANTEIARRLGVAEATVRKRVARLLDDKVIKIGAWVDPLKIGYQIYLHIEILVDLPEIETVAQKLAAQPETFFVGICAGGFEVFVAAVFRSHSHLDEFFTKRLSRLRGIQSIRTSTVLRVVKRDYRLPVPESVDGSGGGAQAKRRKRAR